MDENMELDVDMMAAALGLPDNVAAKAKEMIRNGMPCDRCGHLSKGEELDNVFAFIANTPKMPTSSPPSMLCERCGYLTAAFMGINAAKEICERRGWS